MPSLQVKVLVSKIRDRSKPISSGDGKGLGTEEKGMMEGVVPDDLGLQCQKPVGSQKVTPSRIDRSVDS